MNEIDVDVLIVGGTPAGCAAAIAAARSGKTACILEPTVVLGGAVTSGVSPYDAASEAAICGLATEFCQRVAQYYRDSGTEGAFLDRTSTVYYEPHVSAKVWREMVDEHDTIQVLFGAAAVAVEMVDDRIRGVLWEQAIDAMGNLAPKPAEQFLSTGKVFVDATYEGDVAAEAGVPFRIGREPRSNEEPHAGILFTNTYAYDRQVASYYPPHTILPGSTGAADDRPMASNSRIVCQFFDDDGPDAAHRIDAPPPDYDPNNYAWNPNAFVNGVAQHGSGVSACAGGKFGLNHKHKGTDFAEPVRDFVLAHPRDRKVLREKFVNRALGFLYYIQTDGGTPQIGLAVDEFIDNNNIPYCIYVREGRRIEGLTTMTESDINPHLVGYGPRPPLNSDAVTIGDYEIDIKKCQDDADGAHEYPEGAMFNRAIRAPYQIPYGCMVPKNVANLFVTCALSMTHVAFAATRLEPFWTQTGMAVGLAASIMIDRDCGATGVPIAELQSAIIANDGKLIYYADVSASTPYFEAIQWAALQGYVPLDWQWRFRPDQPVTWNELAPALVSCLGIAISVTGTHFEGIDPSNPLFRYVETLYDLGSRAGVDIFPNMRDPHFDHHAEFHRAEVRTRWLRLDAEKALKRAEVIERLEAVANALTIKVAKVDDSPAANEFVSRAQMCAWLLALAIPTDESAV